MSALLQKAVDTVNSVAGTSFNIFSSFITFNYYVGDWIFSCLQLICSLCSSVLVSLFLAVRILLEDLVVFLAEVWEAATDVLAAVETGLNLGLDGVCSVFGSIMEAVFSSYQTVTSAVATGCSGLAYCVTNIRFFFDLLGRSIFLLCNLLPRTVYVAYITCGLLGRQAAEGGAAVWRAGRAALASASPELLLGAAVGLTSSLLLLRLSARVIRERQVTAEAAAGALLRLVCRTYVCAIRLVARLVGLVFTVVEMTISHLRVPMFAHAGDSDDEDEDRENLVGEVDAEDEEEQELADRKRKNYRLVVERAGRRGSSDSVEGQLLREMEREREDKLCVVCQDNEKCIMILPCRHLCICEGCQGPLRTHRNTCPICRRGVKQMIKAYL